jgi:uncharacterized membrane protein
MRLSPLLLLHITGGLLAILSGFVAMAFRKGFRGHRIAGTVFFVSMLCMAGSGAFMAFLKFQFQNDQFQITNVFGGSFALYLVATAWSAARRSEDKTSVFDWGALLIPLALLASFLTLGIEAVRSPTGLKYGYPPVLYFVWAFMGLLCAVGDIRLLLRGGISGAKRIARHLWRMSFALFIAAASFFLGQQKVMPVSWRGSKLLFIPPIVSLILLFYWLIRVLYTKAYKKTGAPSQTLPTEHVIPNPAVFAG